MSYGEYAKKMIKPGGNNKPGFKQITKLNLINFARNLVLLCDLAVLSHNKKVSLSGFCLRHF